MLPVKYHHEEIIRVTQGYQKESHLLHHILTAVRNGYTIWQTFFAKGTENCELLSKQYLRSTWRQRFVGSAG
jgi:hypothetical protein